MQDHSFYEGLKKESLICAQCGYCRVECPVYKQIGWESSSPRAKMLLAGKIADGNQINEQEALRIFQCTMCGRCKEQCSTRIDTIKVWEDLRQEIAEQGKSPGNLRILTQTIEENGNITGDEQANRECGLTPWMMINTASALAAEEKCSILQVVQERFTPRLTAYPGLLYKFWRPRRRIIPYWVQTNPAVVSP